MRAGETALLPARGTSFRDWAQRLAAACAADGGCGRAFVLARDAGRARAGVVPGCARSCARCQRHGRASDADAAGCADGGAADAGCGSVPWRHQRCAADGSGACGGGLAPAAGGILLRAPMPATSHAVLLDLEGHGREEIFADVDLSRTVGWFTSQFRCGWMPGRSTLTEALAGGPALGRALKRIKEQLRALPANGLGYGLLRYLNARDRGAACGRCGAAAWLQLFGADWRRRPGTGSAAAEGDLAWRRGSGDAVGACS